MRELGPLAHLFWIGPVVIAFVTPFYMARSFALTFLGKPRNEKIFKHAHEAPWTMVVPQAALATMAVIAGWFLWKDLIVSAEPKGMTLGYAQLKDHHGYGLKCTHLALLYGFAWILAIGAGIWLYKDGLAKADRIAKLPGINLLYTLFARKFYFDALYDLLVVGTTKVLAGFLSMVDKFIIDGLVNGAGHWGRQLAVWSGWMDRNVVDGAADGAAEAVQSAGRSLRVTQVGNIRGYVAMLFAAAMVIVGVVVAVVAVQ
jgi:NADH-quinone oxidoreductase subunit L